MKIKTNKKIGFEPYDLIISIESEREQYLLLNFFGSLSNQDVADKANLMIRNDNLLFNGSDSEIDKFTDLYGVIEDASKAN